MIKKLNHFINDNTYFWLNFIVIVIVSYFSSYIGLVVMTTGIGYIKVLILFLIISSLIYCIQLLLIIMLKFDLAKKYIIFFLGNTISFYLLYIIFYKWLITTFNNFLKINS